MWLPPALPMTARGWATEIMEELMRAGATVPVETLEGFTMQDVLTDIVETIMDQVDVDKAKQFRDVAIDPRRAD